MNRRYDIDALRILAFALLILYHVGMVYVQDWSFHIKSEHQWEWLQWPMLAVNRWRMSLLFLISGLALGFALNKIATTRTTGSKGIARELVKRSRLLLIPLVFGMLLVVPVQAYIEARTLGTVPSGFIAFMSRYLELRPWPEAGFAGASHGVTWNHLWYLAYLWCYTVIALVVYGAWRTFKPSSVLYDKYALPSMASKNALIILPVAYLAVILTWLAPQFPVTHALTDDWYSHASYFPVFCFGLVIARNEVFWAWLERSLSVLACLTLLVSALYFASRAVLVSGSPLLIFVPESEIRLLNRVSQSAYTWAVLLTILGLAQRFLNRPFKWVKVASPAVYPWYILHQSIIIPLAYYLSFYKFTGCVEFLMVTGGTVVGCAVLYKLVISRVALLRVLFGMKPMAEASSSQWVRQV